MEVVLVSPTSVAENPTIGKEINTVSTLAGVRETTGMINLVIIVCHLFAKYKVLQSPPNLILTENWRALSGRVK